MKILLDGQKRDRFCTTLDPLQKQQLRMLAIKERRPVNELMEEALAAYLPSKLAQNGLAA